MSDSTTLTDAVAAFAGGEPSIAGATALKSEAADALMALVTSLSAGSQRAHLEAIGESKLPKAVRKAARKAAYKLKSAGVEGEVRVEGPQFQVRAEVDLEQAALLTAPGMRGEFWLLLSELPQGGSAELRLVDGSVEECRLLESLSRGKLRNIERNIRDQYDSGLPVLTHAGAAVRFVRHLEELVAAGSLEAPEDWPYVKRWADAAVALGADPDVYNARIQLASELSNMDVNLQRTVTKVVDLPVVGVLLPPEYAIQTFVGQLEGVVHSDIEIDRATFDARLNGMADSAADAWLAADSLRERVAGWLDLTADTLLVRGHRDGALQVLWTADELRSAEKLPHENALIAASSAT